MSAAQTIVITLRLFGALRAEGERMTLDVPAGSSVAQIRAAAARVPSVANPALIGDCAIANDTAFLAEETVFQEDTTLCLLPPVCGG